MSITSTRASSSKPSLGSRSGAMRLASLPGSPHLTYCTNIHAGETWAEIAKSLERHVPAIKAQISPDAPLGLGLRLSGIAAAELVRPHLLDNFRDQLAR